MSRKLHAQQQEFQAVYECIDKLTQVGCQLSWWKWKILISFKVHVPCGDFLFHADPDQDPARVHHQHWEGPVLQVCDGVDNTEDDDGDGVTGTGSTRSLTSGSGSTGRSTGATGPATSRTPTWTGSTLVRSISPQRWHTWWSTQVRTLTRVFLESCRHCPRDLRDRGWVRVCNDEVMII